MQLLKSEGFRYEGYVDLFDAGPTMQADRHLIRTVRKSLNAEVKAIRDVTSEPYMISNTRLEDFTIVAGYIGHENGGVAIDTSTAKALGVKKGDKVRYAP
jgi:arginine N-succinyltransferase